MRLDDLDLRELLAAASDGVLRFGERRALLFDAVALGLLRKELVELLGWSGARSVLTRFGYAHGWRTAEVLEHEFPWESRKEWQRAGGRLHTLQGLVRAEPVPEAESSGRFAEVVWHDSYEAEQHVLHLGQHDEPVCWSLCGFASGYLSYAHGSEVVCIERRCAGAGDACCIMVGDFREKWGPEIEPHLAYYERECLDPQLVELAERLERAERRLRSERRRAASAAGQVDSDHGIVAHSEAMRAVLALAERVARVDSTVLITGESGVGKERVARLVHDASPRAARPFVALNAAALPDTLLESELFGHVKGAFTGAVSDRPGAFEAANGGTLLLDEVGEMPPAMQAKLLRTLQEREVVRLGETLPRKLDVRVVAATNRDLVSEVQRGSFREDLYYRLRVIEIAIPPLRERPEDVLPLARWFLASACQRYQLDISGFEPRAADQLARHAWPGNVRELANVVERAAVLATGSRVTLEDLPEEVRRAVAAPPLRGPVRPLAEVERDYILSVLDANDGQRSATAEQLGIGVATLYRKLKRYRRDD